MTVHSTAIIDPAARVHETVDVGAHCVIDAHVQIDAGCRLYHGVFVTGWTHIGAQCVLHPGAIVGHEPQDTHHHGGRSYCRVGPRTIIREYVTIHRGTDPESETVVGEGCFLLGGCHVAHNCRIGDDVTIINNALLAGHVDVGDRAVISGGAVIHQFVRIGAFAMIGGNARVSMDVVPYAMVDVKGRVAGLNTVGLRRAGVPRTEIEELRQAFRNLFGRVHGVGRAPGAGDASDAPDDDRSAPGVGGGRARSLPFSEAIVRVREQVTTPAGRRLAAFLAADTPRGVAGGTRRHVSVSG
ncbi:MAG: acyl-ACP--UDP-N-acetylglucosamine O-acyltransferase [Phycisphaerae bacterium]